MSKHKSKEISQEQLKKKKVIYIKPSVQAVRDALVSSAYRK